MPKRKPDDRPRSAVYSTLTLEQFKMVRDLLKMSQNTFADRTGIRRGAIGMIETNRRPITRVDEIAINALCVDELGLTLQEVLTGEVAKMKKHRKARVVHRWVNGSYVATVTDEDGSLIADIVTTSPVEAQRLIKYGFGITIDLAGLGI